MVCLTEKVEVSSPLVAKYIKEKWALWSFKRGLLHLTETLENKLNNDSRVEIKQSTPCQGLDFSGNKVIVRRSRSFLDLCPLDE